MSKILLIGDIDLHKVPYNGEKMKNQLFLRRLGEVCDKVIPIDTRDWRKRPWCLVYMLLCLLFYRHSKVIISSCDVSASKVIKFLYYFRFQKEVYFWVVGGGFHHLVEDGTLNARYYHYLKKILVQSPDMQVSLEKSGLRNVMFVPNSKPLYPIEPEPVKDTIRFVFLSRVEPTKGCDLILSCTKKLNAQVLEDKFNVTFFGTVDPVYESSFKQEVEAVPNVTYKGLLNLTSKEGYKELAKHDVFLFPTFYENEGFPGVVVDAYIAGLPIIATDWHFNAQFVKNGSTGVVIPAQDEDALLEQMASFISGKYDIEKMKRQCLAEATLYDIKNVLSEEYLKKIELI